MDPSRGTVRWLVFVLGCAAMWGPVARAGGGDCDGQGDATLERLGAVPSAIGNTLDFEIRGRAMSPVAVIADLGSGPVTIPRVGMFCLDLGPQRRILFDGIRDGSVLTDASGTLAFEVPIPNQPTLAGKTVYFQGVIQDDQAPNGYAISNLVSFEVLSTIVEDFSTIDRRDEAATTAMWDGDGFVVGTVASTPREVDYLVPGSPFNVAHPLVEAGNPSTPNGCRFQMRFPPGQVGAIAGESIIAMSWSPRSNFVYQSSYRDMTIKLGNTGAGQDLMGAFDDNYESEPTVVYEGDYDLAHDADASWVPWPSFAADFEHDASKPLVFEVDFPVGGDTFQLFRNRSTRTLPRNRIFANGGAVQSTNGRENTTYQTRFQLFRDRSFAQSDFIDSSVEDADWSTARIDVTNAPAGTRVEIEFEGADDVNGDGIPDSATFTGFTSDIDAIDGSRFVRFKLTLKGNRSDGAVTTVDLVSIPYR